MSLTDELTKLAALRQSGALTETEFQQAKAKLLGSPNDDSVSADTLDTLRRIKGFGGSKDTLGEAANRYVSFQMIMAVVGLLLFLFFFAPMMCRQSSAFGGSTIQLR
ncbi:MAG TPA: SHOCT domain-containing protein [Rariglobus sp.]|nr:SHOCT domain-containing protein [Rariglobus sp.]